MAEQEQKDNKVANLSNEFQREIKERKKTSNWLALSSIVIVSLLVFVSLALGTYEIFFKSEEIEKNKAEKIESKPSEDNTKVDSNKSQPLPATTSTPPVSTATTEEYTIADGDNLGAIATKYGTTVEKLKSANNIQDETLLQIGQIIKIVK